MKYVKAYHFTGDTLRDGRPVPAVGEWLEHDGACVICESGLHASRHPFDAMGHAPGNTLHLVECEDVVDEHYDKFVCRRRRIIKSIDAESLLREFARWCALQVVDLWDAPDVVRRYLETGDDSLRAAAGEAARGDATATAEVAAWASGSAASCDSAMAAACDSARAASRAAARSAALSAAKIDACHASRLAAGTAAEAAVRSAVSASETAAEAAAWHAQGERFAAMVEAAFAEVGE